MQKSKLLEVSWEGSLMWNPSCSDWLSYMYKRNDTNQEYPLVPNMYNVRYFYINKKTSWFLYQEVKRCVRDSNPWPHAWQACILTNWTNAPIVSGKRDSNSRPQPWQGCALPTELFPQLFVWVVMDSNHRRRKPADLQSAPFGHSGNHPLFVTPTGFKPVTFWSVVRCSIQLS